MDVHIGVPSPVVRYSSVLPVARTNYRRKMIVLPAGIRLQEIFWDQESEYRSRLPWANLQEGASRLTFTRGYFR
jgi:hypothetical protein